MNIKESSEWRYCCRMGELGFELVEPGGVGGWCEGLAFWFNLEHLGEIRLLHGGHGENVTRWL
jgi:hypothetical protein